MKTQTQLAQNDKITLPHFPTTRLTMRPNPAFATSTNRFHLQKLDSRLNWLTVIRTARIAGMNA